MSLARPNTDRFTYGDYRSWLDAERYELVDGLAYAMAPAPTRLHQRFVLEIARQIADALEGGPCEVDIAPFDVRLPEADEADDNVATVVQPDILVVCDPAKLDEKGCRGAPDWVIEVTSGSTANHDRIRKLDIYQRHGVREYWLVNPSDRVLTRYRLVQGKYGDPEVNGLEGVTHAVVAPVALDWDRVL